MFHSVITDYGMLVCILIKRKSKFRFSPAAGRQYLQAKAQEMSREQWPETSCCTKRGNMRALPLT